MYFSHCYSRASDPLRLLDDLLNKSKPKPKPNRASAASLKFTRSRVVREAARDYDETKWVATTTFRRQYKTSTSMMTELLCSIQTFRILKVIKSYE